MSGRRGVRTRPGRWRPLTAPGGFGVLHDVRWVEVFNRSPWTIGLEIAAMLVVRSAIIFATVVLVWPADVPRPLARTTATTAVAFTVGAAILLTPSATILFAMAVAPLIWRLLAAPVIGGVPTLLGLHTAVPGGTRRAAPAAAMGWLALTGLELTLAGLAVDRTPGWPALVPAAASGVWNALAWRGIACAVCRRPAAMRGRIRHRRRNGLGRPEGADRVAGPDPGRAGVPQPAVAGARRRRRRAAVLVPGARPRPPAAALSADRDLRLARIARAQAGTADGPAAPPHRPRRHHRRGQRGDDGGEALPADMLCAVPGIRERAHLPVSTGVAAPERTSGTIPVLVLPAVHGGLVSTTGGAGGGEVHPAAVVGRVRHLPSRPSGTWRIALSVVRSAGATWQVPTLGARGQGRPAAPCP